MSTVLVTGSRNWTDEIAVMDVLVNLMIPPENWTLIHGDCPYGGADQIAAGFAKELGAKVVAYPADTATHGKRGFFFRNKQMVDENPDIVLAFPLGESKGTHMTIKLAVNAGIPTFVYGDGKWHSVS